MDTVGTLLQVTTFGESHGPSIGCVLSGMPAGHVIDKEALFAFMARRAPGRGKHMTARLERDLPRFLSGVSKSHVTTGAAIAMVIDNTDARSSDYKDMPARPSHADYPAFVKYSGNAERAGGGRFSGRLTATLCCAGALCLQVLQKHNITIGAHLVRIGGVAFEKYDPSKPDLCILKDFPVANQQQADAALEEIEQARLACDSVGGQIECAVLGLPVGIGEPFFDSIEATLSRLLFSIPAVKGVQFGLGFDLSSMRGSASNDAMKNVQGQVVHTSNNMGGIDGGMSNGEPILFTVAIKPTATIAIEQQSISLPSLQEASVQGKGRHDPCIAPRAVPVVEAVTAIALLDLLLQSGTIKR